MAFVVAKLFSVDTGQLIDANNFYKRSWWPLLVLKFPLRVLRWASGNWTNSAPFASCGLRAFLVGIFKSHTKGQKCFCFCKQLSGDSVAVCFFWLRLTFHTCHQCVCCFAGSFWWTGWLQFVAKVFWNEHFESFLMQAVFTNANWLRPLIQAASVSSNCF